MVAYCGSSGCVSPFEKIGPNIKNQAVNLHTNEVRMAVSILKNFILLLFLLAATGSLPAQTSQNPLNTK